ncbi:hypothetical protein Prudu_005747 [Prunus dulcis]|jgi:hypothetical protein
MGLSL